MNKLTTEEIEKYREYFSMMYENEKSINLENLVKFFENLEDFLDEPPTYKELEEMIRILDTNNDKQITFDEFISNLKSNLDFKLLEKKNSEKLFKMFDLSKRQKLTIKDLNYMLRKKNIILTTKELNSILKAIDLNLDNYIDFEEFTNLITSSMNKKDNYLFKFKDVKNQLLLN